MNKLGKLLLSLSLIFVIGCSKDSSNDEPLSETGFKIEGNWRMHSYSYFGSRTDILEEDVTQRQFTGIGWEINMDMVFSESPNNYSSSGSYYVDHIVTNSEGQETLYYGYFEVEDLGTWVRNGTSIDLILDGETSQGTITELTDTTLEFIVQSSTSDTNWEGTVTNITRTDTYRYIR
ncbi:MAG: hypothetical protein HKN00_12885 [Flavobacteriaceae bacterium]|nr:hypothetical protein [Bacteroidia bacterium]NNF76078.1 hypothetical protein [Flavobacteriaceae bacterium]NNK73498.1 hypothetical protein [Flavobacteriaceae bacterium]